MRQFPGGVWYEPGDLGFDDQLIGASGSVNGNIVPWCSRTSFSWIAWIFEIDSGSSASFNLRAKPIDLDGTTLLADAFFATLVTTLATDAAIYFSPKSGVASTSSGAVNVSHYNVLIAAPYVRFTIVNNDGVNPGNVTLRLLLGK